MSLKQGGYSTKPIVVGVVTGIAVTLATLILQDFYGCFRNRVTTKALITFHSAKQTTQKDGFHKTYNLQVVNYAVPNRSPAKLLIYDTARDIIYIETNAFIAPLASPDNPTTNFVDLRRKPRREVFVDILMPPPRTSSMFMVEICAKEANSDDSTLGVKLAHDGGLYDMKMPKLKWE